MFWCIVVSRVFCQDEKWMYGWVNILSLWERDGRFWRVYTLEFINHTVQTGVCLCFACSFNGLMEVTLDIPVRKYEPGKGLELSCVCS